MSERDIYEEKRAAPKHFNAIIKGLKTAWEVDVWDAVGQVSKQSLRCSPSSKGTKEAKLMAKLTQILVANLRWVKDYSPSEGTEKFLHKFEQLIVTMILAANLPPQKKETAHKVLSRLSASLDTLLSNHAAPSNDADAAFIDRVKQQLAVIQLPEYQLPELILGMTGKQSGSGGGANEEEDLVTNFASFVLDSVVVPIPQVISQTTKAAVSSSFLLASSTTESKQEEIAYNARFLPCLLDYFREHPKQFPVVTQGNARTFIRHVLKGKYGITQTEIARAIGSSGSSSNMSNWMLGKDQEHNTVGEKVIEWINGPYQNWLLGEKEDDSSQPCVVYAKFPEASPQEMIEINNVMHKWLRDNADVSSVQVGLNVNNQVAITISCDRALEDFLDPSHPILPQLVLDHADVVVLSIEKRQDPVLCTKIVRATASATSCVDEEKAARHQT